MSRRPQACSTQPRKLMRLTCVRFASCSLRRTDTLVGCFFSWQVGRRLQVILASAPGSLEGRMQRHHMANCNGRTSRESACQHVLYGLRYASFRQAVVPPIHRASKNDAPPPLPMLLGRGDLHWVASGPAECKARRFCKRPGRLWSTGRIRRIVVYAIRA